MNKKLTCFQVNSLLSAYLEGKLNTKLQEYIELHLKSCTKCKQKADELQRILKNYNQNKSNKTEEKRNRDKTDYKTIKQLSAYMDNELNQNDNIKIKKMTITNSKVRSELETLYRFQKALHYAYKKTKNEARYDFSKNIITQLQDGYEYSTTYFYKLAAIFAILLTIIIFGFIYLYF